MVKRFRARLLDWNVIQDRHQGIVPKLFIADRDGARLQDRNSFKEGLFIEPQSNIVEVYVRNTSVQEKGRDRCTRRPPEAECKRGRNDLPILGIKTAGDSFQQGSERSALGLQQSAPGNPAISGAGAKLHVPVGVQLP